MRRPWPTGGRRAINKQTLHKIYQHNINELKKILQNNNLTIIKPDKSKSIVIIDENTLEKKSTLYRRIT